MTTTMSTHTIGTGTQAITYDVRGDLSRTNERSTRAATVPSLIELDGVDDPTERIARLLGVKSDFKQAIGAGSFGDPGEVNHARLYIEWVDQQSELYLVATREANDRQAAKILGRGVKVLVVE